MAAASRIQSALRLLNLAPGVMITKIFVSAAIGSWLLCCASSAGQRRPKPIRRPHLQLAKNSGGRRPVSFLPQEPHRGTSDGSHAPKSLNHNASEFSAGDRVDLQHLAKRRAPAAPSSLVSIQTHDAWVEFPIFDAKTRSLKNTSLRKAGGTIKGTAAHVPVIEALRNITISLTVGDRVGLVGHNGAGKSTLLRLLSGIYEPTRGRATIRGRVAPIFDLGVGMDPEISGYENIIIRGLFLGETRKTMQAKVDEIAAFTELGDYLSMPLRTYSTGMRMRLAIGVVTSIDPEILLLDEAIGSVDTDFLKKAQSRLQRLVERSGILVFATHSNDFLAQLCKTAIWIDHGEIQMTGSVEDVVRAYHGGQAAPIMGGHLA